MTYFCCCCNKENCYINHFHCSKKFIVANSWINILIIVYEHNLFVELYIILIIDVVYIYKAITLLNHPIYFFPRTLKILFHRIYYFDDINNLDKIIFRSVSS